MGDETQKSGIGPASRRAQTGIEVPDVPSIDVAKAMEDGAENDRYGANGVPLVVPFDLDYVDARKRRWTGTFKFRALSVREKLQVGLTRARLAGGLSPASLDPGTNQILEVLAHLAVALVETPEWAKDLSKVHDEGVLATLYEEAARHERRFHGAVDENAGDNPSA